MSSQGVVSSKKTSHSPELNPIKGHQFGLGIQISSWDKFLSLSLGTIRAMPSGPMLVNYPAIEPVLYGSLRDPQGKLRSYIASNRAHPRSHYLVSRHVQGPNRAPRHVGRDVIQCLLALLNQQWCCSSGLKWFQCHLTIRAYTVEAAYYDLFGTCAFW